MIAGSASGALMSDHAERRVMPHNGRMLEGKLIHVDDANQSDPPVTGEISRSYPKVAVVLFLRD